LRDSYLELFILTINGELLLYDCASIWHPELDPALFAARIAALQTTSEEYSGRMVESERTADSLIVYSRSNDLFAAVRFLPNIRWARASKLTTQLLATYLQISGTGGPIDQLRLLGDVDKLTTSTAPLSESELSEGLLVSFCAAQPAIRGGAILYCPPGSLTYRHLASKGEQTETLIEWWQLASHISTVLDEQSEVAIMQGWRSVYLAIPFNGEAGGHYEGTTLWYLRFDGTSPAAVEPEVVSPSYADAANNEFLSVVVRSARRKRLKESGAPTPTKADRQPLTATQTIERIGEVRRAIGEQMLPALHRLLAVPSTS